jgi:DNA-binding transcriptional ArsR family regulator
MSTRINWLMNRKSNCKALFANTLAAKAILGVLANENRLKILCCLVEGEKSVHQITTFTELHQPTVSQQLAVLRLSELVASRRDGKAIYYSLTNFPTRVVLESLDELFELRALTHIPQNE